MTQSKHTPGPYKAIATPDSKECDFCILTEPKYDPAMGQTECEKVGFVKGRWGQTKEEIEADANLFAAAPDLLEALKTMVQWAEPYGRDTDKNVADALAAIAKAEGRQS